ncbi:hypothetical protein XENTR_v10022202 [Xenopus tropicalis]|nr:hypothetical protein XENTR_v10022202 [Xenopus tropicalis]
MITTIRDSNLHTPMYFFLWNLSFIDIGFSSVSVPKMLTDFFATRKLISFGGCMSQICFFHFFGTAEVLLLAVMSYDRFVAIGNPLRYILIMNSKVCLSLALSCWISGFFHSLLHTVMTAKLPYCQANLVNHFFCDVKPVLKLACTDTSFILQLLTRVAGSVSTITFAFTFLSYFFIIKFVIQIRTKKGRRNAFSTCSAHLTVVFMLYGTAIFTYMRPLTQQSLDHDRVVAVLFTVVTPALNPLIYTLRNKEMRVALKRIYKNVFYL